MDKSNGSDPMNKDWLIRHITPVFGAVSYGKADSSGFLTATVQGFRIITGHSEKEKLSARGLGEENALYNLYYTIACSTPAADDFYGASAQTYNGQGEHVIMDGNDFKKSGKMYSKFFNCPVNNLNPSLEP
jgi:hypothetical protein